MNFLKKDLQYEAKINRKKLLEAERKKRIFDPKTRLFGVDLDAWDQQLHEKRKEEEQRRADNEQYYKQKLQEKRILEERERVETQAKRELEKQIVEFRDLHQKPTSRREFDINDPDAIKTDKYSQNGVSRFEGEDNNYKRRVEQQKQENKAWLLQQIMEKKRIADQNEKDTAKMVADQVAMDRRAVEISQLEAECKRRLDVAIAQFNKFSAEDRANKEREEARQEARIEAQEIDNWVKGDWLTENPSVALSALGPGRVVPYMYKGQPYSEHVHVRQEQLHQAHLNKMAQTAKDEEKRQWEQYDKAITQRVVTNTNKCINQQRELDRRTLDLNTQLAQEQRQREAANNDITQLKPSKEFFDQFNRTTY